MRKWMERGDVLGDECFESMHSSVQEQKPEMFTLHIGRQLVCRVLHSIF